MSDKDTINTYKVVMAKEPVRGGYIERYNIINGYIPLLEINQWLASKSNLRTAKKYAYMLVSYLNYLDLLEINYREVTKSKIIKGYINYLLFDVLGNVDVLYQETSRSARTVKSYIRRIQRFYKWLEAELEVNGKYREIWDYDYYSEISDSHQYKKNKEYIKWYTDDEVAILATNFRTIRDKVIFLITVEGGCRIDEVLTIKYTDYDGIEGTVYISESKTAQRTVHLPDYVCREIDRYIDTERRDVETDFGLLEHLFVNLRRDKSYGNPITYSNFNRILKNAAARAGFDYRKIKTHSGRSTKAQNLIEHQIIYPEDGVTDAFILETMGWRRMDSIKPYKKELSNRGKKEVMGKIELRKRQRNED